MYLYNDAGATAKTRGYFGPGEGPVFMTYVNCRGTESTILECSYSTIRETLSCGLESDAGVQCLGKGDISPLTTCIHTRIKKTL